MRGKMTILRIALALVVGAGILPRPAPAQVTAYATAILRVREAANDTASILATIPYGSEVARDNCSSGWCRIAFGGITGYSSQQYLTGSRPPAADACIGSGRGYTNSRGEWVPSPCQTSGGGPPAGASAQCRDGTYSFSRSRRGTCSGHGGVARWLGGEERQEFLDAV